MTDVTGRQGPLFWNSYPISDTAGSATGGLVVLLFALLLALLLTLLHDVPVVHPSCCNFHGLAGWCECETIPNAEQGLTHCDLFPQELGVLLAVLEALLGLAQPLGQQRLRLVHRVRQHDICAEPDVYLVGGWHLGLSEQRVVELEGGLDRVRLVLGAPVSQQPQTTEPSRHGCERCRPVEGLGDIPSSSSGTAPSPASFGYLVTCPSGPLLSAACSIPCTGISCDSIVPRQPRAFLSSARLALRGQRRQESYSLAVHAWWVCGGDSRDHFLELAQRRLGIGARGHIVLDPVDERRIRYASRVGGGVLAPGGPNTSRSVVCAREKRLFSCTLGGLGCLPQSSRFPLVCHVDGCC